MPYRFTLNGTDIECDSAQELVEALGSNTVVTPTTPERRARRQSGTGKHAASRSWDIAKFYSAKRGVKMDVREARSYLGNNPDKKDKIEQEMIEQGLLQPT